MARLTVSVYGLSAVAFVLAGCLSTSAPVSDRQTVFNSLSDACHAYASALRVAAVANGSGRLNDDQVMLVDTARAIVNPVCDGPAPTDALAINIALKSIQTSLYELVILSQTLEES